MTPEGVKRKISAILSADVAGYTHLMEMDETATVQTIKSYRKTISSIIEQHSGRLIDSPGDNLLSEFRSVVNAVQCAIEIQHVIKAKNAVLPDARRMEFRIGINLGDVIEEESGIYGEGVNLAARIEGIADPGGICISGSVYEQIENKLSLDYEDIGEHALKNIRKLVRIYKIPLGFHTATDVDVDKNTIPTEKPSIAVLPFDNMSGDPEQEYFSDGMTEEIITRLSMNSLLIVMARNSTFQYKGKPIKVQQIGDELCVQYVLEGSVRKAGDQVRITAQLVDAETGAHLWANTYDREFKDIFNLQEETALLITSALNTFYTEAELSRIKQIPNENLTAIDALWRAQELYFQHKKRANTKAREFCERAIALDPDFAGVFEILGFTYLSDYMNSWNTENIEPLERAYESAQNALSQNAYSAEAHDLLAFIYAFRSQKDRAIAEIERAIAISPYADNLLADKAHILVILGKSAEAIGLVKKAMRMNPQYPSIYAFILGTAYLNVGRHEQAIETLEGALALNPDWVGTYQNLARCYRLIGRYEEAIGAIKEVIIRNPNHIMACHELAMNYRLAWEITQHLDTSILNRALELAEKSISVDSSFCNGYSELSLINLYMRKSKIALEIAEHLITIFPESAESYITLAYILNYIGRSEEAPEMVEKAIRLNASASAFCLNTMGTAYRLSGMQNKAKETLEQVFEHNPSHADALRAHLSLTIIYAELGREEDAKSKARDVLKAMPAFSAKTYSQRIPYIDIDLAERDMEALRKAGLK